MYYPPIRICKLTLLALLLALLSLPTRLWADPQAYVRLSDDGKTLTFRYDEGKQESDYSLDDYTNYTPAWCQDNISANVTKVIFEASFASARPTTCMYWFDEMKNLTDVEGMENLNTSEVTNMSSMFTGCSALTSLNLSSFNTSKVTDMSFMFFGCSSLTAIFVGDGFVLSDGCYGDMMFYGCTSLSDYNMQKIGSEMANTNSGYFDKLDDGATAWVGYDDVSKTLTFHYSAKPTSGNVYDFLSSTESPAWLADNANVEKVVIDKSFANVRVTSFHSWFEGMGKLACVEGLKNINMLNVTDMSRMFYGCATLSQLDFSLLNTSNVTTMTSMFEGCTAFTSLDLSLFSIAKVTDMSRMFYGCSSLKTIYVSKDFTLADDCLGTDMFGGCSSLSNFDNTKIGKDMATLDGYFTEKPVMWVEYQDESKTMTFHYDCKMDDTQASYKCQVDASETPGWMQKCSSSVEKVVIDSSFADARPTTCNKWFCTMEKLTDIVGMEYLNTSMVTNMYAMFASCSALKNINLSHFNTSNVTNMSRLFNQCNVLSSLDLSSFNTSKVTSMDMMFFGCSALTSLDLSSFNTSNVTNMYDLFCDCTNLKDLNISSFNTHNVTDMSCMFYECCGLTELDLSHFDTSNVIQMFGMFSKCTNLKKLNVSSFNTSKVTDFKSMFGACSSLTELDLYSFDNSASEDNSYMFTDCSSLKNIYVSDKFTGGYNMFDGCTSLPNYNKSNIGSEMANYKDGYLLKKVGTNGDDILGAKGETLTVASLPLADSKAFTLYENCKATEASYSRDMTSTWGTLCLPYSINATASENTCRFYELQGVGQNSIWLKEIENGTIAAGTPVLVCKKEENQTTINVVGADADVVTEPVTADSNDRLAGTFDTKVLKDNSDCYFIAKNHFYKVSDYSSGNGVQVKPFRAYLQTITAARSSQLSIMDDATGINTLVDELNTTTKDCYDFNGRRTAGLHKGINILRLSNGKTKKVIVK